MTRITVKATPILIDANGVTFHTSPGSPLPELAEFPISHASRLAWEDALYYYRAEIPVALESNEYDKVGNYLVNQYGQEIARIDPKQVDRFSKAALAALAE